MKRVKDLFTFSRAVLIKSGKRVFAEAATDDFFFETSEGTG
jgi:hypothetical protein